MKCLICLVNPEWQCKFCHTKVCVRHRLRPKRKCKLHCGRENCCTKAPPNAWTYTCTTTNHQWGWYES